MEENDLTPIGEPIPFVAEARKANKEGTVIITIPNNTCKVLGIELGDSLKLWVKKLKQQPQEEKKEE